MEIYKPKELRKFWYVDFYSVNYAFFEHNSIFCALCIFAGNCFKTKKEALKHADEMRSILF